MPGMSDELPDDEPFEEIDRTGTWRVTDVTDDGTEFIVEAGCAYYQATNLHWRLFEAHANKPRMVREEDDP
jgi:hypothetical protein